MLIQAPWWVSKEINCRLEKTTGRKVMDPHITLGRPFHSTKRDIRRSVESWLEMQSPFRFNLDTVECFNNGVVYLTSSDVEQKEKLRDWFYGIKSVTDGGLEENIGFCPHLTIIKNSDNPKRDVEILENEFNRKLNLEIKTIKLFRGTNGERWESLGYFTANDHFTENTFYKGSRTSIS